jgi:hypothetical protein
MPVDDDLKQLKEEVKSWAGFKDALREEDRKLFREMLTIVERYWSDSSLHDRYRTEVLFMCLLLAQHGMIKWLQKEIAELKAGGLAKNTYDS